jgi:ABC-2 type transport system ATP-binding protein
MRLRTSRSEVARVLGAVLDRYAVEDVSVEDPPLEEVIADLFARVGQSEAVAAS